MMVCASALIRFRFTLRQTKRMVLISFSPGGPLGAAPLDARVGLGLGDGGGVVAAAAPGLAPAPDPKFTKAGSICTLNAPGGTNGIIRSIHTPVFLPNSCSFFSSTAIRELRMT